MSYTGSRTPTLPVVEAEVHSVVDHHQRPLGVALGIVALLPVSHQRKRRLPEEVLNVWDRCGALKQHSHRRLGYFWR